MTMQAENPLSRLLELVLYFSVVYIVSAKVIRALLKKLSVTQHARDRCAEATLLCVSSSFCLFMCWTELRPRRDVHRKENSIMGVFTQNRFKCLGPAAVMVVSVTEVLLQLTRVICCIERKRCHAPVLTYLSFSTYVTAWMAVFLGLLPQFFLRPCIYRETSTSKMPLMCFLCVSLIVFYVVEVATMPLVRVVKQWILPTPGIVVVGTLERFLIPLSEQLMRELRELHAWKLRSRAEQGEYDIRHGSCKKTRDFYKSLKMIMTVKRRMRNFRQTKLLAADLDLEDAPTTTALETSGAHEAPITDGETLPPTMNTVHSISDHNGGEIDALLLKSTIEITDIDIMSTTKQ